MSGGVQCSTCLYGQQTSGKEYIAKPACILRKCRKQYVAERGREREGREKREREREGGGEMGVGGGGRGGKESGR